MGIPRQARCTGAKQVLPAAHLCPCACPPAVCALPPAGVGGRPGRLQGGRQLGDQRRACVCGSSKGGREVGIGSATLVLPVACRRVATACPPSATPGAPSHLQGPPRPGRCSGRAPPGRAARPARPPTRPRPAPPPPACREWSSAARQGQPSTLACATAPFGCGSCKGAAQHSRARQNTPARAHRAASGGPPEAAPQARGVRT